MKLIQDEVPFSWLSTGGRRWLYSSRQVLGSGRLLVRSYACVQMQRISGTTSQLPFSRTPPHGPLRKVLGQVIGQVMPVEWSTHWPHMRQSQIGFFMPCSISGSNLIISSFRRAEERRGAWRSTLSPCERLWMRRRRNRQHRRRPHIPASRAHRQP